MWIANKWQPKYWGRFLQSCSHDRRGSTLGQGTIAPHKPQPSPPKYTQNISVQKGAFCGHQNTPKSISDRDSATDPAAGAHDAPLVGWGGDTPPHILSHSAPLAPSFSRLRSSPAQDALPVAPKYFPLESRLLHKKLLRQTHSPRPPVWVLI